MIEPAKKIQKYFLLFANVCHFLFLEKQSQFHCINVSLSDAPTVRSIAARIVAEPDILTSDAFQANLQPSAWTTFVDEDALYAMGKPGAVASAIDGHLRGGHMPAGRQRGGRKATAGQSAERHHRAMRAAKRTAASRDGDKAHGILKD
jgi:hypothetical protein